MRIRTACLEGRQAYWVCPLIDESEEMPYQAAEETGRSARALPELTVAVVHDACRRPPRSAPCAASRRGDPPAGGYHRDRGGRRCAQRHAHGDRERRAHGARAIASSCAAGSAAAGMQALACCCIGRPSRRWHASASSVMRQPTTVSKWRGATSNCAAPANCSAPARRGSRRCGWPIRCGTPISCRGCRSRRSAACATGPRMWRR